MEQADHLARLPFAVRAVALMPDAHVGYGMPIGGVLATSGVVVPNAVGVDIGCGMTSSLLDMPLAYATRARLKDGLGAIRRVVPVGFAHHQLARPLLWTPGGPAGEAEAKKATQQVGTLGGGNHFIELQADNGGGFYVTIHSGSRNVGFRVADHYNRIAKALNGRWHVAVPADWDLAFLPTASDEGAAYVAEMTACVEFARLNRAAMMDSVLLALSEAWNIDLVEVDRLDVAHNSASMEHHNGRDVMVHRKGATRARDGERGIIPGSQGTHSYRVAGKGNLLSWQSCSHGAGRRMGRKQAERTLDLADEQRKLDEAGVLHAVRGKGDLDEAPGAYKSIEEVMANQTDLVDIVTALRPLAVLKG